MVLNSVMKFIHIERKSQQHIFRRHVLFASGKEAFERIILLGYTKHAFCLNRPVDSEQYSFILDNVIPALFSECIKGRTYLYALSMLTLIAFSVVRTAFAGLASIYLYFALISC